MFGSLSCHLLFRLCLPEGRSFLRALELGERQEGGDSKVRRPTLIQGGNTAVRPYCIVFVTVWISKNTLY